MIVDNINHTAAVQRAMHNILLRVCSPWPCTVYIFIYNNNHVATALSQSIESRCVENTYILRIILTILLIIIIIIELKNII